MREGPSRDFREYLQNEFLGRCRRNGRYSLRAFARTLEIESSVLSKLLRGERGISQKMHRKLGEALGLSMDEIQRFDSYPSRARKEASVSESYRKMAVDVLEVLSDWYHHAIIELSKTKSFQSDPKWIAGRLGISVNEVGIAIERLKRVGLLKISGSGAWQIQSANSSIKKGQTTRAARSLQDQILQKSIQALHEIPIDRRSHTSMTMAIDPKKLSLAEKKIREFRRELCALLQDSNSVEEVYQLSVSLFPLTNGGAK